MRPLPLTTSSPFAQQTTQTMAGEENRRCPHFDANDGVCGCPDFWHPAQSLQHDSSSSSLREASSAPYSQSTSNRQLSSSANLTPLPEHKRSLLVTPAPPGPPKETCFFWYHGSCRRGDDCERPHEAHTTWPISPPPGFRHYQPCTLPLCPLRSDLATSDKPHEYQRRLRTMGGQVDGATLSRARSAGENSSDNHSNTDTDTDMNDTVEITHAISEEEHNHAFHGSASREKPESAVQTGEVKTQMIGRNGSDESDYFNLSQLLSPLSTPIVKGETLLSISHPGTLSERRRALATKSFECGKKRCKLEKVSHPELKNTISLFERPRKMSQCGTKPPSFSFDGQHSESAASQLAALHSFPPHQSTQFTLTAKNHAEYVPPPFDISKGPRGLGTLSQVCFFYYHEGYCRLRNSRKCEYLHDMNTSQHTISLPYGIDNHDPACSLLLCPGRLGRVDQVKHEDNPFAFDSQPEIKHVPLTPPRTDSSPFIGKTDSSPRDLIMAVRGRPPKGMLGQSLPRLTGLARDRFKEQKHRIEQVQAKSDIGLSEAASAVEAIHRRKKAKQVRQRTRRAKKRALANAAEEMQLLNEDQASYQDGFDNHPDAWTTQPPLRPLPLTGNTPTPTVTVPVGESERNCTQRNHNRARLQHVEEPRLREPSESEDMCGPAARDYVQTNALWAFLDLLKFSSLQQAPSQPSSDGDNEVSNRRAYESVGTEHQKSARWLPLATSARWRPSQQVVPYEYSQDSLGLTSEERRAEIIREQLTRREAHDRSLLTEVDEAVVAEEGMTHLAAEGIAAEVLREAAHEIVGRRTRCQRYLTTKRKCDRGRSCLRCIDAGISPQGCVDRDARHKMDEQWQNDVDRAQSMIDYQLPEGDERLDWDTDVVRRLFGEIEY